MTEFFNEHGETVVNEILQGAPTDATLFVYAYVAKSIDYLKLEDGQLMVFNGNKWRVVHPIVKASFNDIAFSLLELKQVSDSHELVNSYGGVTGANERLEYFANTPLYLYEHERLSTALGVVTNQNINEFAV